MKKVEPLYNNDEDKCVVDNEDTEDSVYDWDSFVDWDDHSESEDEDMEWCEEEEDCDNEVEELDEDSSSVEDEVADSIPLVQLLISSLVSPDKQ